MQQHLTVVKLGFKCDELAGNDQTQCALILLNPLLFTLCVFWGLFQSSTNNFCSKRLHSMSIDFPKWEM